MSDKMPSEVLEKFKQQREEAKASSGEELSERKDKFKRAKSKARKVKSAGAQ